jgi:hypothetical protein
MNETLQSTLSTPHWINVIWCYGLGVATFAALAIRAAVNLAHWKARDAAEKDR